MFENSTTLVFHDQLFPKVVGVPGFRIFIYVLLIIDDVVSPWHCCIDDKTIVDGGEACTWYYAPGSLYKWCGT